MTKDRYIIVSFMMLLVLCLICIMMSYPFFWYDEAGQVWIAKGLNHYSDPLLPEGGFTDVIFNNRNYNMDPGGFSVLLWLWVKVSNSVLFIRFLPLCFFLLASLFIYKYYRTQNLSTFIAIIATILPFVIPIINTRLYEVRAYSMELAGCIAAVWAIQRIKNNLSLMSLFGVSCLLAFFVTSRYGYLIVTFYVSIRLLIIVSKEWKLKQVIVAAFVYSLPLLIMLVAIYFGVTSYQDNQAQYVGYLSQSPKLLLSPLSILYYLNILILLFNWKQKKTISELQLAAISVSTIYFVLSFLSLFPWDFHRTISASFLLCLSLFESIIMIIKENNKLVYSMALGIITLLIITNIRIGFKFKDMNDKDPMRELISLMNDKPNGTIFVASHYSPVTRYYYEYMVDGDKRKEDGYPDRFVIGKDIRACLLGEGEENLTAESLVEHYKPAFLFLEVSDDANVEKQHYLDYTHIYTQSGY